MTLIHPPYNNTAIIKHYTIYKFFFSNLNNSTLLTYATIYRYSFFDFLKV